MSQFTNFTFSSDRDNLIAFVKSIDPSYAIQQTKTADFYRAANLRIWARDKGGLLVIDGSIEQDSTNHDSTILSIIHNPSFRNTTIAI